MKYDLQEVAAVSGMPGLYKVLKPTRTGVVLESMDAEKKRLMAQTRHKISILKEISIFTTSADNNIALEDVFSKIYDIHSTKLSIDAKKASNDELKAFLKTIVPDFDESRVYASDIKKLVQWYQIVVKELKPIDENAKKAKEEESKEDKSTKPAKAAKSTKAKTSAADKKTLTPKKSAPVKTATVKRGANRGS